MRPRFPLALAAAAVAGALAAAPAQAGHLLSVTDLTVEKGKDFAATTDKYWAHSKVYRRGDRLETTVKLAVTPGWELWNARLVLEIGGPPGFTHVYDVAVCDLRYKALLPPPPPATGSCTSPQGTVAFKRFDGLSPVLEISLKRPAVTDVRVGAYRLLATVTQAELFNPVPATDCVADPCRAERSVHVLFNPYPGSGDGQVTGLSPAQLAYYALGDEDTYYPVGARKVTLRPADKEVFDTAIGWVDALGTASAKTAVEGLTDRVAGYAAGRPLNGGSSFTTANVPAFVRQKAGGAPVCGQCMTLGSLTTAFDRAVGVPSRLVTARPTYARPAGSYWNFHVWSEIWLNEVTNSAWSAHDAATGKPAKRQDPVFKDRFDIVGGIRPRAFATKENGTPEEVTQAYNPRPQAVQPPPAKVIVYPATPVVRYGNTVHFAATFANPEPRRVTVPFDASLTLELLGDHYLRADNVAFARKGRVTIPARGRVLRMFAVTRSAYSLSGTFAVRASMALGGKAYRNSALVRVGGGLDVHLLAQGSPTPGHPTHFLIAVENQLAKAVKDVRIAAHVPDYMQPSATSFRADLRPRAQRTFRLTLTPPDGVKEVIEVQAVADSAGVALGSLALGAASVEPPDPLPLEVKLVRQVARVTRAAVAALVLSCPAAAERACSGRVTLSGAGGRLGSSPFTIAASRAGTVKLRLSRSAATLVRRQRRLRATAAVVAVDGRGNSGTVVAALTLVAA